MTHRNTADYFAGIPQYAGRISPADLNAAKAAAWDEGAQWAAVECEAIAHEGVQFLTPGDNPYREVS